MLARRTSTGAVTSIQGLIAYATAKKAGGVIAYRRVRGCGVQVTLDGQQRRRNPS